MHSRPDAPTPAPAILTVTQLNQRARLLLERNFTRVSVVGEVSGLRLVTGHRYFSLKDAGCQIPMVLFAREASFLKFAVADGMEVVATGRLTVYPPQGRYQMVVDRLEPRGAGALQVAFEQLKERLAGEGLFAAERKRRLPLLPRRVAVVTSPSGAVIRDIVTVATRRLKGVSVLVVPARVQGAEAAPEIAAAIDRASKLAPRLGIEVIIVARGGGSLEDLWAFNEEVVARAIARAAVPVVSAVGHETDTTIADFVADVRAPTPSAAAELVFPERDELLAHLERRTTRAVRAVRRDLQAHRHRLHAAQAALPDARALIGMQLQRLHHSQLAIDAAVQRAVSRHRVTLGRIETRLAKLHPQVRLSRVAGALRACRARIDLLINERLRRQRAGLTSMQQRLQALSPLAVLERGYAIVLAPDGSAVRDASSRALGDRLEVRLAHGRLGAVVERVEPEKK